MISLHSEKLQMPGDAHRDFTTFDFYVSAER